MSATAAREKLLIVGPSWVGDMVMAHSLYQMLWDRPARPEVHVLAPPWSLAVLARMPEVARAIPLPVAHGELALRRRWSLGRLLRSEGYARAIVLPRSWKSALIPFLARVPVRTGFRGEWRRGLLNDVRPLDTAVLDQTVKRFAALGLPSSRESLPPIPRPRLAVDAAHQASLLDRYGLRGAAPAVALIPGAEYGPAKRWPVEQFAALARRLAAEGTRVWVLGSAKEAPLGEALRRAAGVGVKDLCGETTLSDAIDLLAAATAAVTNDSGMMHVAAAVGIHVIAIYGSSSPSFTPPLTRTRTIVRLGLECSPCWQRTCPLGHTRCLREIPAATVAREVMLALAGAGAGARGGSA